MLQRPRRVCCNWRFRSRCDPRVRGRALAFASSKRKLRRWGAVQCRDECCGRRRLCWTWSASERVVWRGRVCQVEAARGAKKIFFCCKAVPTTGRDIDKTDASSVNRPQKSRPCLNRHQTPLRSPLHPPFRALRCDDNTQRPNPTTTPLGRHNRFLWCEVRLLFETQASTPALRNKRPETTLSLGPTARGNRPASSYYTLYRSRPFALRHLPITRSLWNTPVLVRIARRRPFDKYLAVSSQDGPRSHSSWLLAQELRRLWLPK